MIELDPLLVQSPILYPSDRGGRVEVAKRCSQQPFTVDRSPLTGSEAVHCRSNSLGRTE